MVEICKKSEYEIDEKIARLNAAVTMLAALLFVSTWELWIVIAIGIDFFVRAFIHPVYSPIAIINSALLNILKVKSYNINAGPKIFAAKIGFVCCVLILILYLFEIDKLSILVSCVLGFFAGLEAFSGYCGGSRIYAVLEKARERTTSI
jgi:hypothetical protein